MPVVRPRLHVQLIFTIAIAAAATGAYAGPSSAAALNWQSCSRPQFDRWKKVDGWALPGFDCASFTRPLDRRHPSGKQVKLAVVKLPANGTPAQRKGTLFMNPGGPGQTGVGLSEMVFLLPPEVRAAYDFVSYDPRGIGASTPALSGRGCNIPKPTRPVTGSVDWRKVLAARQKQVSDYNSLCFKANRALVENGGSVDGAYDLDAMRAAVGDSKITYWGISYGTLLGSTYAQLFPNRVRGMVFDGNMDPQGTLYGISAGSVAPDHSIGFFLEANGLRSKFNQVIAQLNKRTIPLAGNKRYTRWDLLDVLNDDVDFYPVTGDQSWAQSKQAVTYSWNALFGSNSEKAAARKALTAPDLRSPTTGTAGSHWSAVVCQDYADRISNSRQQDRLRWITKEGPIYGGSLGVDYLTTCNGYSGARPSPIPRPKRFGPPIAGIISNTTRDGETPYQWAVNMARTYPTMRAITLVGGIHGTFGLSQSSCVDTPIANFLVTGSLPAVDLACPFSPPPTAP